MRMLKILYPIKAIENVTDVATSVTDVAPMTTPVFSAVFYLIFKKVVLY
jgi:hypothetical protein